MERVISNPAHTILLPRLCLTEVVDNHEEAPLASDVLLAVCASPKSYFSQPCQGEGCGGRLDNRPEWMGTRFNLFLIVLDSAGVPWAEATVYILSRLEGSFNPTMGTYSGIADDLAAYLRFIESSATDWTDFPTNKMLRPTYRYRAYLWLLVNAGELAASTAKRRMGSVIAFYRWLQNERVLSPTNQPWIESDLYINFTISHGAKISKKVATTDLAIHIPKANDPYSDLIDDGGKLRPLPEDEQRWLLEALLDRDNIELTLIHLFALLTGARIQTVLTFRVCHVTKHSISPTVVEVRIPVGPGTGADTKNNKQMVLHMPAWFYEILSQYAKSNRAIKRRTRAKGGDSPNQYLFLSIRSKPLYESKEEAAVYNSENVLRHTKDGQGVRQLITEYIIPSIRLNHKPDFWYRFHDLRATYGMNLTDEQLKLVESGEITLHDAREFVKARMGHESAATTDLYLQHRGKLKFIRHVNNQYGV